MVVDGITNIKMFEEPGMVVHAFNSALERQR